MFAKTNKATKLTEKMIISVSGLPCMLFIVWWLNDIAIGYEKRKWKDNSYLYFSTIDQSINLSIDVK